MIQRGAVQRFDDLLNSRVGFDAKFFVVDLLAAPLDQARSKGRRQTPLQLRGQRPVLLRLKGADISFAFANQTHRHRLHAPRAQSAAHLVPQQGADLVTHQPVEDAARDLGVELVAVQFLRIGYRFLYRFFGDLVDQHAMDAPVVRRDLIGYMPGDGFAFAVGVGGKINIFLTLGCLLQLIDDFFLRLDDVKVRREVFLDVHAELALGQIDDMSH